VIVLLPQRSMHNRRQEAGLVPGAVDKIGEVENQKTQQAVTEAQAGNLAIEKQSGTSRIAIYMTGDSCGSAGS